MKKLGVWRWYLSEQYLAKQEKIAFVDNCEVDG